MMTRRRSTKVPAPASAAPKTRVTRSRSAGRTPVAFATISSIAPAASVFGAPARAAARFSSSGCRRRSSTRRAANATASGGTRARSAGSPVAAGSGPGAGRRAGLRLQGQEDHADDRREQDPGRQVNRTPVPADPPGRPDRRRVGAGPRSARRPGSGPGRRPRRGRRVPPGRVLLQALQADRAPGPRGTAAAAGSGSASQTRSQRVRGRRPAERRAAGQTLVQDGPQGPHVGRRADRLRVAAGLLGGHVGRACPSPPREAVSPRRRPRLASPKSATLGSPSAANRTLAGFRSRWTIPGSWAACHPAGDGLDQPGPPPAGRAARRPAGRPGSRRGPAPSTRYGSPRCSPTANTWTMCRVLDGGGRLGLGPEPVDGRRPAVGPGEQHLEGDEPVQAGLAGPVDDPHPAAAQFAQDGRTRGWRRPRPPDRQCAAAPAGAVTVGASEGAGGWWVRVSAVGRRPVGGAAVPPGEVRRHRDRLAAVRAPAHGQRGHRAAAGRAGDGGYGGRLDSSPPGPYGQSGPTESPARGDRTARQVASLTPSLANRVRPSAMVTTAPAFEVAAAAPAAAGPGRPPGRPAWSRAPPSPPPRSGPCSPARP